MINTLDELMPLLAQEKYRMHASLQDSTYWLHAKGRGGWREVARSVVLEGIETGVLKRDGFEFHIIH